MQNIVIDEVEKKNLRAKKTSVLASPNTTAPKKRLIKAQNDGRGKKEDVSGGRKQGQLFWA